MLERKKILKPYDIRTNPRKSALFVNCPRLIDVIFKRVRRECDEPIEYLSA